MVPAVFDKIEGFRKHYRLADCYDELIYLFISVTHKSSIAYLAGSFVFVWFLYDVIPLSLLIPWAIIQFSYPFIRLYLAHIYKNIPMTQEIKIRFQYQHIGLAFIAGIMWGSASIMCAVYAPSPYEYMVLTVIVGLTSGSLITLSSLYPVYLAFNFPALFLLMLSFILYGDSLHYAIASMIGIFIVIVPSATWNINRSFKHAVELNRLYAHSQAQLKEINASLEEKVREEVEYNRQKDQQMLAQSRLAQMGEMISMIAHQWRQPLSAIIATTGSMSVKMQLDEYDEGFMEEGLKKINMYSQYLSTTISDFRNFFKQEKEKDITSFNDVVLGTLQIIGNSLENQGIIVETYLDAKVEFHSYPNEIKQVLLNLLKNAQDMFFEQKVKEPRIIIKTENSDDKLSLRICDNGGGIADENIEYIFDPYFTTKEKLDGTGLGLYMSKLIIEDHCNGTLSVSNEDEGACFTISLPQD